MLPRLLDEADDAVALEHHDAEPLGLGHPGEEDLRVRAVLLEPGDEPRDPLEQHVVPEVHHERLAPHEVPGGEHRVREAEGRLLLEVGDAQTERGPVADRRTHLVPGLPDDDPDLGDAGLTDRTQDVEQDRRVRDRDQLLRVRVGERPKARALPSREDERPHEGHSTGASVIGGGIA